MSQFDEDAHIDAILGEIGYGSRTLADIGARYGGSNCTNLIRNHGFTGVLYDADEASVKQLAAEFPTCQAIHRTVQPQDVNELVPPDTWFLSLDIDSFDWWVWANLIHRPALVVVETNPLNGMYVAQMKTERKDRDGFGMSLEAAKLLGELKGYDYLGRNIVNAFFTRKELNCQYRLPEVKGHAGIRCGDHGNVFLI